MRKHLLSEKLPVLSMLISMFVAYFIISVPGVFVSGDMAQNYVMSIASILWLLIMGLWFRPDYKGSFKLEIKIEEIAIFFIPYFVYCIICIFANALDSGWWFKPTMLAVSMGICAGCYEETIVRGVTLPIGMRYMKSKNRAIIIVVLTSLIFGLSHFVNIKAGADFKITVIQVINAIFLGIFFAAVFLRTGSILISIVMHGFFDWICFVIDPTLESGIMTIPDVTVGLMIQVIAAVVLGIVGLYMIRPAMADKIEDIWNKKWNISEVQLSGDET